MDTDGIEAEQLEGRLLELGWLGAKREPVFAVERRTHGVLGQGSEMRHEASETHDAAPVGGPFGGLFGFDRIGRLGAVDR